MLSYVDDFVYWYTYEVLGHYFVYSLVKRSCANFLEYAHWFMYIRISRLKNHSVSVDQDRYDTYDVAKYIDTATIKENSRFNKTVLPHDMILTK